jgi:RimJ/RimL family protein N-acetyltransferase
MATSSQSVQLPGDKQRLLAFLCEDDWPFHGRSHLGPEDVERMDFPSTSKAAFWVVDDDGHDVGLVRLLDLDDIGTGVPTFDVRIASQYRGEGHGTRATQWLVEYCFTEYPELHRIEAYTRIDNAAMQQVLAKSGFVCEGTLREAWWTSGGEWFSALVYGILRSDVAQRP